MKKIILHRAPLVVPVAGPIIENGAILVVNGRIVAVDKYDRIEGVKNVVDHEGAVLLPSLINCHAHLELSFLAELGMVNDYFKPGEITDWIENLLEKRAKLSKGAEPDYQTALKAVNLMYETGHAGVADIGNLEASKKITDQSPLDSIFFLEMLGLRKEERESLAKRLEGLEDFDCTGHAPYSTAPETIVRLKKRSLGRGGLFSIHVGESLAEIEFLKTGNGRFKDFLEKRFQQTANSKLTETEDVFTPPGKGAVAYLNDLGVIDQETICVHCVHVDEQEINILADKGAQVCLCPGSNKYLGVGTPPVSKFVDAGLKLCLGTDSLASNSTLNIWREMQILAQQHGDVPPETILQMATINGASALKMEGRLGSFAIGKSPEFLAVRGIRLSAKTIYEDLVNTGTSISVERVREYDD